MNQAKSELVEQNRMQACRSSRSDVLGGELFPGDAPAGR
jgi:hypothetical protein